jgi:cyclopropane-fatty-acyl-phospholipid synthase
MRNHSSEWAFPVLPHDAHCRSSSAAPAGARRLLRLLERLSRGTLRLQLPDGTRREFGTGTAPVASMRLQDWNAIARTLRSGDIGFAESYLDGEWSSDELPSLLELFLANREHLESALYGSALGRAAYRLRHLFRRNSRAGSRRNVHAHYDLGNDFYALWLDPGMNYSAGWFDGSAEPSLEEAQRAKIRRALVVAGVRPGSRVLEIGCGWGGLAEVAARDFGAQVTGITLSAQQLAYARARVVDAGVASQCDLRLQDYRDLPAGETYDAVVSIEMFEAVGYEYWDHYLETVRRCLRPGGRACMQSITIRDDLFARYLRSTDFIQQYIFPGGLLPGPEALSRRIRRAGLVEVERFSFGRDYGRTLRHWRENFRVNRERIRALGFDERFLRLWDFYLAYCEAAFSQETTDVMQFLLQRC